MHIGAVVLRSLKARLSPVSKVNPWRVCDDMMSNVDLWFFFAHVH
jgi:hypothetical protein